MKNTIPEHAHPLVKRFFEIMRDEDIPTVQIARTAGLNQQTVFGWRYKANPSITSFEAALNAAGYRLDIVEAG